MSDEDLNEIRQLIETMQSNLVELFDQLRELRSRLNLVSDMTSDVSPSILPLFSEVKTPNSDKHGFVSAHAIEDDEPLLSTETDETDEAGTE